MDRLEIDVHMNQTEFDSYVLDRLKNAQSQTLSSLIGECKTLPFSKTKARKTITYANRTDYSMFNSRNTAVKLKPDFEETIRAIRRDYSNEQLFNTLVRDNGFWDFEATKVRLH